MGETIRAAIWLSDLRDFSGLSETLPRDEVIALLNDYFGAMSEAVTRHGGEILKFIGDAMLAIFPVPATDAPGRDPPRRARRRGRGGGLPPPSIASALPAGRPPSNSASRSMSGDVMYGNIGSATRLDFTVIGPAVNLASRISSLCATLGKVMLMSHDFAAAAGDASAPVGSFELKGVSEPQLVYAP